MKFTDMRRKSCSSPGKTLVIFGQGVFKHGILSQIVTDHGSKTVATNTGTPSCSNSLTTPETWESSISSIQKTALMSLSSTPKWGQGILSSCEMSEKSIFCNTSCYGSLGVGIMKLYHII
jgi:hypothetical protein